MNCYNECKNFIQSKKESDLGRITEPSSCSYCLYWNAGPGNPMYGNPECECNSLITSLTRGGTEMNIDSYKKITECLKGSKNCGVMYASYVGKPNPKYGRKYPIDGCGVGKWMDSTNPSGIM